MKLDVVRALLLASERLDADTIVPDQKHEGHHVILLRKGGETVAVTIEEPAAQDDLAQVFGTMFTRLLNAKATLDNIIELKEQEALEAKIAAGEDVAIPGSSEAMLYLRKMTPEQRHSSYERLEKFALAVGPE